MNNLTHNKIPSTIQFEVTYSCNSNCIFCYNPNRGKIISKCVTDSIIENLSNSDIYHIQLTGGELSLVPQINTYIEKLKENHVVTIVTNGLKRINNLSTKLDAVFVSLHGLRGTHEYLTNNKGTYDTIIDTIKYYVSKGLEVYTDTILTSHNYNEIYDLVKFAKSLGVKKCYVNRYEIGGIGSKEVIKLMPSLEQFKEGITKMITAKKDFQISVGFCTSIPFCIDERIAEEGLDVSCGIGTTFAVVNPTGDLRICNQSNKIYGNILNESIEEIWKKTSLNDYRELSWVKEPCRSCILLEKCVGGCRVDNNCKEDFCIDYYLRKYSFEKESLESNIRHYINIKNKQIDCSNINIVNKKIHLDEKVIFDKINNTIKSKFILITTDELGIKILDLINSKVDTIDEIDKALNVNDVDTDEIEEFIKQMINFNIIRVV